ncbi:hypothetical protein [Nodosilinea sp. E11]|uniref:hypothetical protein n=1 Tax=Nodosilinea sp. E11 TaxID=3037479 RepID=UPI0029341815|nr:hypothetical protein [Nodosilinea sp. E11]WOD39180.1 hypothetical protein RRF56_23515 [Nodosilinea sp. E11]
MSITDGLFHRANDLCRRRAYEQWQRRQSKQQILRSQVGFRDRPSNRPSPCQGCANYHGIAYGTSRARRSTLVCAIHPQGWQGTGACADWREERVVDGREVDRD